MQDVVSKRITLPKELYYWAETVINESKIPGIRSLSGLIEYALADLQKKREAEHIGSRKEKKEY